MKTTRFFSGINAKLSVDTAGQMHIAALKLEILKFLYRSKNQFNGTSAAYFVCWPKFMFHFIDPVVDATTFK